MNENQETQIYLRDTWDQMIKELEKAREAIDDPKLYPPPPTDRNLAEGYRYLLGFLYGAIDRALSDPDYPHLRRAIQPLDKATIDNADAIYLCGEIDGNGTYTLKGKAQDHRHWRDEARISSVRKAPQYVIFEVTNAYAGDSGNIMELMPGSRVNTGTLDSSELIVEPDGTFEVLLAPERPDGHTGNFIATKTTRKRNNPDGTTENVDYTASYLVVRELFYDWDQEDALELHIARVGNVGTHPGVLDSTKAAYQMKRIGEIVNNQMRFWNEFYAVVLETYQDMNGDGKQFMPRNAFNDPAPANLATGGGQSTNVYAGGVYDLGEDEALIVEIRTPVSPAYMGLHLSNLWGESLDYANHISSLNDFQAELDSDGVKRCVIAHRDPGVPNWLDTTNLPQGFIATRWSYTKNPHELPTIKATKVAFNEIRAHLPSGVRTVSEQERREQICIRQEHVQRRYRQY